MKYLLNSITLKDQPVYGAGRAGMLHKTTGVIEYELTDHLGNVRATFKKISAGVPQLLTRADYYAFGGVMPGRSSGNDYRYNYQGQENAVNSRLDNFELRMLNTDLGRWISPDPYSQFASAYISMGNNPVSGVDPDGGWTSPNYFSSAGFVTSAVVSAMVRVNDGWPTMFDIFCATYFAEEIGFMNSSFLMGGRGHGAGGGYGNGGGGSGEFGNFLDASNNAITMQYELTYTDANGKKSIVSGIFNNRQVAEKYAKIYQNNVNKYFEQQKQQELLIKSSPRVSVVPGELFASAGKGPPDGKSRAAKTMAATMILTGTTSELPPIALGVLATGSAIATYQLIKGFGDPKEWGYTLPGPGTFPFDYQPKGFDNEGYPNGNWSNPINWAFRVFMAYEIYDNFNTNIEQKPPFIINPIDKTYVVPPKLYPLNR